MNSPAASQPLGAHLRDLRRVLLRCAAVILVTTIATFSASTHLFRWLTAPFHKLLASYGTEHSNAFLQTLQPAETFKMSITLALLLSAVIVLPYLLLESWRFVRPGLHKGEQRWVGATLLAGTSLFFGGASFAYTIVLPLMLRFFWEYSLWLGITPSWTVAYYADFVMSTLFAFGIAFELPVVTTILASFGIVNARQLRSGRRYAIFGICLGSAVITPPDIISLFFMALPLIVLYELAIVLARIVNKPS